jgi:hypothetical protein
MAFELPFIFLDDARFFISQDSVALDLWRINWQKPLSKPLFTSEKVA